MGKCCSGISDRPVHIFLCVRGTEERGLELRGRQVDTRIEHSSEETAEGGGVGLGG